MTEHEKREHALRIAADTLLLLEYSDVYEDEELENATEAEWEDIHEIIISKVRVSIDIEVNR